MATTASTTTTGISESGITKIKDSINEYVTEIQKTALIGENNANIESAIKGSSSEASLRQMNKDISADLARLVSSLKEYNVILDNILASYKSNDTNNATFSDVSKGLNK